MNSNNRRVVYVSEEEKIRRKKFMVATLITCIVLAMIFGIAHVVKLGANRMADMRGKAGYDLKDEAKHIRAAGEDIVLHRQHEQSKKSELTYELAELDAFIEADMWETIGQEVSIPEGKFFMGSSYVRADLQDQPQHQVSLPNYYIDKYPVTNIQYAKYVSKTKRRAPLDWEDGRIPDGKYLHPVVMVSWYDAKAYCKANNKRLPTEQEWEKAARGVDGRRWPWGNEMDPKKLNTYYNVGSTTEVTRYENGISHFGVVDLAGNVSEWTESKFEPYEGSTASKRLFKPKAVIAQSQKDRAMKVADIVELDKGEYKVRRGGSWKSDPFATSVYHRNFSMPHYASDFFGFRCVRDAVNND